MTPIIPIKAFEKRRRHLCHAHGHKLGTIPLTFSVPHATDMPCSFFHNYEDDLIVRTNNI